MQTRTDIFIDVDGVINAMGFFKGTPHGWPWSRVRRTNVRCGGEAFRIHWAPELVDELNELAARPDVRMHWLTTWCSEAARRLSPALRINGQGWTVVGQDVFNEFNGEQVRDGVWWKFRALRELEGRSPRTVWLDDHLRLVKPALRWAMQENILAIAPNEDTGLTRQNMDMVRAYVNETALLDEATARPSV